MTLLPKKFLVPLCILLVAALIGAIWYYSGTKEYENYQYTYGIVTDFQVTHSHSNQAGSSRHYHYYYSYTVNGATYTGHDLFSSGTLEDKTGKRIKVWYDPDNPSLSTMTINVSLNFLAPFFLAVPLVLGAYRKYSNEERKNQL